MGTPDSDWTALFLLRGQHRSCSARRRHDVFTTKKALEYPSPRVEAGSRGTFNLASPHFQHSTNGQYLHDILLKYAHGQALQGMDIFTPGGAAVACVINKLIASDAFFIHIGWVTVRFVTRLEQRCMLWMHTPNHEPTTRTKASAT